MITKFFNRRSIVLAFSALAAAIAGLSARLSGGKINAPIWIEPEALAAALSNNHGVIVVDVRNPDEFSGPSGHIPGARNIPVEQIAAAPANIGLPHGRPLVMVCLTDRRSDRAAQALRTAGYGQISVLRGGMQRWNAEMRPVAQADLQA